MLSFIKKIILKFKLKQAHLQGKPQFFTPVFMGRKRAVLPALPFKKLPAEERSEPPVSRAHKGSLTIEAAVVLPLFLVAMLFLLGFAKVIQTEAMLIGPLHQTGRKLARDIYAYTEIADAIKLKDSAMAKLFTGGVSVTAAKQELVSGIEKDKLDASAIVGGAKGLSFAFSKVPDGEDMIDLVVSYRLRLPLQLIPVPDLPVVQRCRVHGWTGYVPEEKESEQLVYVTDTGSVYHLYLTCTHLKLSIRQVAMSQIPALRNSSGGKYDSCEKCGKDAGAYVYITDTGDRYHGAVSCSGLKRGIRAIPRSEAGSMPLCKRCGENQKASGEAYVD